MRPRSLGFNHDGTLDVVPELYDGPNVLAWLNHGTGHYVALRSMLFTDTEALDQFAGGLKIQDGSAFNSVTFSGDGHVLSTDAGVVLTDAIITLPDGFPSHRQDYGVQPVALSM